MNTRSFYPFYPLCLALLSVSCTQTSPVERPISKRPSLQASGPQETALPGPARWIITDSIGASFDETDARNLPIPGPEPALVMGKRTILEGGVLGHLIPGPKGDEDLSGFRSLPKHLGGGFVFWSGSKTYYASTFNGDLIPISKVAASGGIRPFLKGILLRTNHGFRTLQLDPSTGKSQESDFKLPPGLADALAADEQRAATLDFLGRIRITKDGGQSWIDLSETRGFIGQSLNLGTDGELLIARMGSDAPLRLLPNGTLETAAAGTADPRNRFSGYNAYTPQVLEPQSRRSLAPELFAQAVTAGALLPGNRVLVARERGLSLLTTITARMIADTDLPTLSEPFRRCQPTLAGQDILLLCTHNRGSHVLRLDSDMARPKLEATFPTTGIFVGDFAGHLAYTGRCGQSPPSTLDFRQKPPTPPAPADPNDPNGGIMGGMPPSFDRPPEEPTPEELPPEDIPPDDARACIRLNDGTWAERRIQGDDARRLYRWIPGKDGKIAALVFDIPLPRTKDTENSTPPPGPNHEDVRVIRLDPFHPELQGGRFYALQKPQRDPPYTCLDTNIWLDDDGSLRAWIALPDPGETPENPEPPPPEEAPGDTPSEGETPPRPKLPLSERPGGRSAGLSISKEGKITVHDLPEATEQVVKGGPYALALANKEETELYYESKDGGKTFQPVLKPPIGRLDAPYDNSVPFGCSPLGCTVSSGLIRLGWGSPAPPKESEKKQDDSDNAPDDNSEPTPPEEGIQLSCRVDNEAEPWNSPGGGSRKGAGPKTPSALGIVHTSVNTLGTLAENTWTADILLPFQPQSSIKKVRIKDSSLSAVSGFVAPILRNPKDPIDLLAIASKHWLRPAQNGAQFSPFDYAGRITAAAEWTAGNLLALDFERGFLLLIPKDTKTTPPQVVLRLQRVSDPGFSRFSIGRRAKNGALDLVIYSATTGGIYSSTLDFSRAQSSPLLPLGSLRSMQMADSASCRSMPTAEDSIRFIAEMPMRFTFLGKNGQERDQTLSFGAALITASSQQVCLEAIETHFPKSEPIYLSASFGPKGNFSVFRTASGSLSERAQCQLKPQ